MPDASSLFTAKQRLRQHLRQARAALMDDAARYAELSQAVQAHLLASPVWARCSGVILYAAVRGEPDTALLFRAARDAGKKIYLPRCRPEQAGQMDILACRVGTELVASSKGIPEPPASAPAFPGFGAEPATLLVVPGLAFDVAGNRLGQGGGYYDRLLASGPATSVGLAFSSCVRKNLPLDPWDRPVQGLCTEKGLLWIRPPSCSAFPA